MMLPMTEVRFDDLAGLRALIRDEPGEWGPPREITQEMIDRFADLTDDHQWIHSDVERCRRESPFGTTIAHGFLILSLVGSLRAGTDVRIIGYGSVLNYGADRLRFVAPVPSASRVHARRRVAAVDEKPRGVQVTYETEIAVVGADRSALFFRHMALYLPPT